MLGSSPFRLNRCLVVHREDAETEADRTDLRVTASIPLDGGWTCRAGVVRNSRAVLLRGFSRHKEKSTTALTYR